MLVSSMMGSPKKFYGKITETETQNKASAAKSIIAQAKEENMKLFLEVMKKAKEDKTLFDILNEKHKPRKIDDEESKKRRERQRRIDELCARIAHHRRKAMNRDNKGDAAMVSSLTSQLVQLMFD